MPHHLHLKLKSMLSTIRPGLRLVLAVILALGSFGSLRVPPVLAALGWVGNMVPAAGSVVTRSLSESLDVYVEVYKAGVTDGSGQGAGIQCFLHWSAVPYWWEAWTDTTDTPMSYAMDLGNNDVYHASLKPGMGLYEYTAYCQDTTDSATTWQGGGNGRLVVKVAGGSCDSAAQGDNQVFYSGLFHDSFSETYRVPQGPVPAGSQMVTLKLRTCMNDLDQAPRIRLWDDRTNTEQVLPMTQDGYVNEISTNTGAIAYWRYDLPVPTTPTILYYAFQIQDGTNVAYYRDDDVRFYGGGYGQAESAQDVAYNNSYQLTVYDPAFRAPSWMQRGIVYQIFPDRFRDGSSANNPPAGRFAYNLPGGTIVRSNAAYSGGTNNPNLNWNTPICDPRAHQGDGYDCAGKYSDNFYGGDLAGITEKINQGYFDNLGITVLYLNPIFRSPSNHKYDTADYLTIDPDLGTLASFQALVAAAHNHGIKLVLDGVFNHTSSDSKYFDQYSRYNAAGDLVSPNGAGADDNSGACEAGASPYYGWFYFPAIGAPGQADGANVTCANGTGDAAQTYEAWAGYASLPKLRANTPAVRGLFWSNGLASVGPYWTQQGADGWRFDVGGDVDCGLTCAPENDYWEGFRAAVRDPGVTGKSDTLLLGEEWGDASAWLLGNEWDSVMNYRFRSAVLSWLFTGCSGNGCNGTGTSFEDNDSNVASSSGAISQISPSQFNARLLSIAEDYPPEAFKAMMNLEGSHDTNRLRFLLKKINNNSDTDALQRMKEWWLFAFTYAGAPTLYYGDEIALNHDGVWDTSWQDDPYNRAPYPWPDTSGSSYAPVTETLEHAQKMASIRLSYRALQDGDAQHGLLIDDAKKLYAFGRTFTLNDAVPVTALIALNRDDDNHIAQLFGLNGAPYFLANGTTLVDVISGETYTVTYGGVQVDVESNWGAVLLEQDKIDRPLAAAGLTVTRERKQTQLSWQPVTGDTTGGRELVTAYEIYRSPDPAFTPGSSTLLATVTPMPYGSSDGLIHYTAAEDQSYYYVIRTYNAAGRYSDTAVTAAASDPKIYLPQVMRK